MPPNKVSANLNENFQPASKGDVDTIKWVLVALVAVLLIGLGGFVESWLAQNQASYEDLKDQIVQQNVEINNLNNEINEFLQQKRTLPTPQ